MIFLLSESTYGISSDSLLLKYGLPTNLFKIILVKDAPKDVFKNLTSDIIKPTDTIIIATIDTFDNKLNIREKVLYHRLVLSGKVFKKGISFYKSTFKNEVFMNECTFFDRVDMSKSIFDSTLILWNTQFIDAAIFSDATFHGIQFHNSKFEEDAQFHETKFLGGTFFITTDFQKGAFFSDAIFNEYTRFSGNYFKQKPWFWEASFLDTVLFNSNNFRDGIDFQSSEFSYLLSLSGSTSEGRIDFSDVKMPKFLDVSSLKTNKTVDFNYINDSLTNYKCFINLYNAELDKVILTNKFSLYFDDYLSLDIKNGIYKLLLDNLNSKGYKNVFKSFDIEYRNFLNKNYNRFFEKLFFSINRLWWNFGYNKQRVFIWALLFILLFSIPIRVWFKTFVRDIYCLKMLEKRFTKNNIIANSVSRFFLNYLVALLYTIFVFFNFKLDFDKLSFEKYFAGIFILFIYSFGLICTAFIINLIITV